MFQFQYSILSIDGGGIRGIIPGMVLAEIERRTETPIAELFDLIAGTSTGGILAGGLALPGEDGSPKYSAKELLSLYNGKEGKEIFKQRMRISLFNTIRNFFAPKFTADAIRRILRDRFGDARLTDALTDLFITSYNTEEKTPFYFRSSEARRKEYENFYIRDIARATSAAPVYFPAEELDYGGRFNGKKIDRISLIDGGVFANNPSVLAYIEALEEIWKKDKSYEESFAEPVSRGMEATPQVDNFAAPFLLISIGTGQTMRPYDYAKVKSWGAINWIKPPNQAIIDILMQGVSESVHYQMQYLLPPFRDIDGAVYPRYYRLNLPIATEYSDMSDVADKNLNQLVAYGNQLIEENDATIDRLCDLLKAIVVKRQERQQGRPAEPAG